MNILRTRLFVALLLAGWILGLQTAADTLTIKYSYDAAGRLALVDYGGTVRVHYVYDAMGNLTDYEVETATNRNLSTQFTSGSAGSYFTITGSGFPASAYLRISINQSPLLPIIQCDGAGNIVFVLSTAGIEPGFYVVSVTVVSGPYASQLELSAASASGLTLLINNDAPLRPPDNFTAPVLNMPAGIALEGQKLFLPFIRR